MQRDELMNTSVRVRKLFLFSKVKKQHQQRKKGRTGKLVSILHLLERCRMVPARRVQKLAGSKPSLSKRMLVPAARTIT